jgi:diaminohydroxyphosphoribosylaminopyrimidine deaminase / 5-amino-6-(5-phosphoribosylamino)uracil reductase
MPISPPDERDAHFMAVALRLAERGLGRTWPNPAVGCVVVRDDQIVGRGWTQPGGRPHAEVEALRRAGPQALGATAYISLEPCAHYGQTPPCTMALLHAGLRRAVIAAPDPDPRVDGRGIDQLRQAGVEVALGIRQDQATQLNAGFFLRVRAGRPLVTLKLATSLDGRIATRTGASRWVTGEAARRWGHRLRAMHDAVVIGSGTALADDPALTCRLPGLDDCSPVRVVLDGRLRLPPGSRLATTAREVPTWVVTRSGADPQRCAALERCGVEVLAVPTAPGSSLAIAQALAALAARGLTRVLVEGGGTVAAALLRARLVDRLVWFQAPLVIGGDGVAAVADLGLDALGDCPRFQTLQSTALAPDAVRVYIVDRE